MEILAAVSIHAKAPMQLEHVDLNTELRPDEVLVKVIATGICHSDIGFRDEHMPFPKPAILGHEGAGVVIKIGSAVTKVAVDDHVVLSLASCGKCKSCISGRPTYCENVSALNFKGTRTDGSCPYHNHDGEPVNGLFFGQSSFATYSLSNERNVVKVTPDVPLELLGPLGCGLQTGAGSVFNVLRPTGGQSIIVSGVGPVGLAAIMAAKISGCTTIIAVDIHDHRLELAKELGATHVINSRIKNISEEVQNNILPGGTDYGLDTTSVNSVITEILKSTHILGHTVLLGMPSVEKLEVDQSAFLATGRSLQYVNAGDSVADLFIPKLISLYQQGLFPFDKLVKFYDLENINQAIEDTEHGITLKAIIRMPHD
ncbi:hypothetical protein AM493_04060 [Flavobacterium akiainvivens]|uniref:Enoyl reductase (ER) domain-containing protein n=1 Tax=Flavobacterium akiainvivens TaxID=1202724 RepID=A0A0M8MLE8_9FLAO|nr:NAD(P)-dependent alcohol dehydrogenase [Flavobacterium akiainvivens]KOS08197.1 hypothetical protein AM493_04060 [Flavobacterium akiainvivens]SFQ76233.1 benzyl alcohol dehydrogenase [Flavobacterium akiainvivens]